MQGELISTHIKPTENTTLAKLRPVDQIKMLISNFSNNDVAELNASEKLSQSTLKMRASLQKLMNTATQKLEDGEHESVTMQVSSKYLPYIDAVIDKTYGLGRYYDFEVVKGTLPPTVTYMFVVKIKRKVSN
mgnify:CR=1 FL=1